jgi:hypothetical protein
MKTIPLLAACCLAVAAPLPSAHCEAPAPQEAFALALQRIASLFAPAGEAQTVQTTLKLTRADGLPKELAGAEVELALAAPDRIRIATRIGRERIEAARDGGEIWIWRPGKNFGVIGTPGLPRFAAEPAELDSTRLGPLALPLDAELLALLPRLFAVEEEGNADVAGEPCRILRAQPLPEAHKLLRLPRLTLTVAVRKSDGWPVRIEYRDGRSADVALELRAGAPISPDHWKLPAAEGAKVERVALGHLTRFFEAAPKMLRRGAPPLGPATGEKTLVARHGEGRLEEHDGTRVLFLKGTPEEMGEQHGTLLRDEIEDMIARVLYGVGVGSSFEKGRWFFGEIEECQGRISPFIDARHLREMDAIARASGHAPQEIRLANFFPELFHCSGFALTGAATADGRIFHGRILDYLKGVGLESNAVVIVHQPDADHAWVNVSYAGFVGSVTAMNERHLSIGEMGGRGEGHWDGKPMAQLVREVMEKAGTLEEAIAIMRRGPRTCEYYYVIADGKTKQAVGIKATPELFEVVRPGEAHPQLDTPIADTVLLSAGDRYRELVRRVQAGYGSFDAESARALMTRPVCMSSNIHSVLFAPDTLDFWVANADAKNVASHARYTHYNLRALLSSATPPAVSSAAAE